MNYRFQDTIVTANMILHDRLDFNDPMFEIEKGDEAKLQWVSEVHSIVSLLKECREFKKSLQDLDTFPKDQL